MDTETYTKDHPPENSNSENIKVLRFSKPVVGLLLILSNVFPVSLILIQRLYLRPSFENFLLFAVAGYIGGLCFFLSIFPKKWPLRFILTFIYSISFLGNIYLWFGGLAGMG